MSDPTHPAKRTGNVGPAVVVGMLMVVVGILAYLMLVDDAGLSVTGPDTAIEGAAQAVRED